MEAFRIADARYPIFDPTGAMLHGGRWNSPGKRVIYAAETYAGALLEVLVHSNLSRPPKHHQVVQIVIPATVSLEDLKPHDLAGWDQEDSSAARAFGDRWYEEARTAVLLVPGVVTQGRERNILFNTIHPQLAMIQPAAPEAIVWDRRLFLR